jgi:hypothetical protein
MMIAYCSDYHDGHHHALELASLFLAGVPYRAIFIVLSSWDIFFAILAVETAYKVRHAYRLWILNCILIHMGVFAWSR